MGFPAWKNAYIDYSWMLLALNNIVTPAFPFGYQLWRTIDRLLA
jgi:hypothetical protein